MEEKQSLIDRRTMLKRTAAGAALAAESLLSPARSFAQRAGHTVNPRSFGAKGDGQTKDTAALQQAIDSCAAAGGGTVLIPAGTYVTGTLVLRGNITFEMQAGATILGSTNADDYTLPPEIAALHGAQGGKHLIFAYRADNLTIRGPGVIDGHSSAFLAMTGRPQPKPEDLWKDVIAFERARTVRISPMVELVYCNNLRVENVTLQNAAGWTLRPVGCNSVTIEGVKIRNPIDASNSDGIDPSCCQDVLINNCDIVTGDDAICVKSYNQYGTNTVCRNVTVTNCKLRTCCNGLKLGNEGPAAFENIVFKDCEVYSGDVPLNERVIAGIDIEMSEHAYVDGVTVSNITMSNVRTPIFVRLQGQNGHNPRPAEGSLRNIHISGIKATGASLTSTITGSPGAMIEQISLSNIQISTDEPGKEEWAHADVPEKTNGYPGAVMMGRLSSYGLFVRHVKGLQLQNVAIRSSAHDPRPMLICDDVQALNMTGVSGSASSPQEPFMSLNNVQSAVIHQNTAPAGTAVYAHISGAESHNIRIMGNDLRQASQPIQVSSEVPPDAVIRS
ncbi:hypothetical protein HNQ77_002029 [Silvibacterium bohemicum]|uniref:Glycoside hydrolase n=1 Tax=Silvibacterium bohemicum TaxID=1577686 RepID=A0A841JUD3_9BACT|nr:glycosyl hydrolase family 28 protein [Silvibacterium bohemicum]MBB6144077.1 hypothetical protein [Silvibacterium bohemicum]